MAEEFLDRAEIGSICQQMRCKRMTERMRMQIPFHLHHARIFFYDGADSARFKTRAAHAEKHSFGISALGPLGANLMRAPASTLATPPAPYRQKERCALCGPCRARE